MFILIADLWDGKQMDVWNWKEDDKNAWEYKGRA